MRTAEPNKRDRIIQAARVRFTRYGFAKTNMHEIAIDADVAVGTLYRYFSDKEAVLIACADHFGEQHLRQAARLLSSRGSAAHILKAYVLARYRKNRQIGTSSRHASELAREVIRVHPQRLDEEAKIMIETLTAILKRGVARREFHITNIAKIVEVFLFSIAHFFPNASVSLKKWPAESALLKVVNWFAAMWRRQVASKRRRTKGH